MEEKNKSLFFFIITMIMPLQYLLVLPLVALVVATSPDQLPPRCHENEASALLEFKSSFTVDQFCKGDSYPGYVDRKLEMWKQGETQNCCTWGGVECDLRNGHVIGLDLSQSCLTGGSINSTSSLFRLLHLQRLNLAYNRFNHPEIPASIGNFSRLTTLNLSECWFAGQIPTQLLNLTNLVSLDLSGNYELKPNLEKLGRSLTKLEELDISAVEISSSPFPAVIANLTSLKFLALKYCELQGEFPSAIFNLPKLQVLDVSANLNLSIHLPEFRTDSPLQHLYLCGTNTSGRLPDSLGNNLESLTMCFSSLEGSIPYSIGNLTKLSTLDLSATNIRGPLPSSFGNMTQLSYLDLSFNQLTGQIPLSFGDLTNLKHLDLHSNQINGEIPASLGNLINLDYLDLESNQLTGEIPVPQISNITGLTFIDLSYNNLQGMVQLDMFSNLKYLQSLILSFNNLSVFEKSNAYHSAAGLLMDLGLGSCKLREFPTLILRNLESLTFLDLSNNEIRGEIPKWLVDTPITTMPLHYLNLSRNSLTSFPRSLARSKWPTLSFLDLSFNELQGSLPLAPTSIMVYYASDNNLSGEISSLVCNTTVLFALDLSNNSLTGPIPQCISSSTDYMQVLNLHGNNFSGRIPEMLEGRCEMLILMDIGNNRLEGPIPKSLSRCIGLEFLNLGNNMLDDAFPSWLGSLDALRVLILRSNKLHGVIQVGSEGFPKLQIIDVSQNYFKGPLPSKLFEYWNAPLSRDGYMVSVSATGYNYTYNRYIYYSVTLTNKGNEMEYLKILDYFKAIDFSSNNFSGSIPTTISGVTGLHLLNLSNNNLIGSIPPSLGDLTHLESLDLSRNFLSGEIPRELMEKLSFLAKFNVSWNNLSGSIPWGNQFTTFGNDSFAGNEGLCGDPLSRKCGSNTQPSPSLTNHNDEEEAFYIEWKAVVVGYASAFIIATLIGQRFITVRQNWFGIIYRLRG